MTSAYFANLSTVEEIKKLYRQLAMAHHPDRGGDTRTMQDVNAAYHAALEAVTGTVSVDDEGNEHTYRYNVEHEQAVVDKIDELIRAGILTHAEIFIIGTWIWIVGDTKPIKDALKAASCLWHSKRRSWYWKPTAYRSRPNRRASLGDLAKKYGATKVTTESATLAAWEVAR